MGACGNSYGTATTVVALFCYLYSPCREGDKRPLDSVEKYFVYETIFCATGGDAMHSEFGYSSRGQHGTFLGLWQTIRIIPRRNLLPENTKLVPHDNF